MPFSRLELKKQSVGLMQVSKPKAVYVAAIYLFISFVLTALSDRLLGGNMTVGRVEQYMQHIQNGNLEYALSLLANMAPTPSAHAISLLLQIVLSVVFAGFNIYLLNLIRGTEPSYGNILDGFGIWLRVIVLEVLKTIFIALWSLLLIIPGIIAGISYSMALYILIDHPEMSVRECLKESKRMMKGRKMEFFLLELSFIGWIILGSFGYAGYIIQIWTLPYMNLTYCLFYEKLRLSETY